MKHQDIQSGEIHTPFNWVFADQTARLGASGFSAGDIDKIALQQSDQSIWVLTSTTPVWAQIGVGSVSSVSSSGIAASAVGQILYSADGTSFAAFTPVTTEESGWLINDDGALMVA